ncbi:MAG: helix-turn-helix domain-containing protein [Alphaproteobacteria bacterium]
MSDREDRGDPGGEVGPEKRSASRQRLLKAARTLFIERGYHEARPQDIAREAGFASGTFYLHFADKRACFLAFADEAASEIDELVERRIAHAPSLAQMVEGILASVEEYAKINPGVINAALADPDIIDRATIRIAPRLVDRWARRWVELLSRFETEGAVADDLNLYVVGHALVGLLHQSSRAQERGEFSREELLKTVVRLVERALAPRRN